MAQGDPPVYQLVDANGNVQAEIRHDLAKSLIIDQLNGSDIDFQSSDLSNIESVSTDTAETTAESAVYAYLSTDQSVSSGTETKVEYDTVVHDSRGEFSATNHVFTPDESGLYDVSYGVTFSNPNSGDRIESTFGLDGGSGIISLREGATLGRFGQFTARYSAEGIPLNSDTNYAVSIVQGDSADTLSGVQRFTWVTIRESLQAEP